MKVEIVISRQAINKVVQDFDKLAESKLRQINIQSYKSANEIRNTAIDLVPVDTGRLKTSIRVQKETSSTLPTNKGIVYQIGTNVDYASKVEFGTGKQRAQPYLRPAFLKEWPIYIRAIKKIWRTKL